MSHELTAEDFLKEVATHQLAVLKDDGLYRHLQFRRPGTSCMGFDLITWPGYLAVAGDMGEYVFQRIEDMFCFFRSDRAGLAINRGYWAEKCQASDARGKIKEFSEERFRSRVIDRLKDFCTDTDDDALDQAQYDELLSEVESSVFGKLYDDSAGTLAAFALMDVEHDNRQVFTDFFDGNGCEEYTYHFTWICFAITWGIQQYDLAKAPLEQVPA